VQIIEHPEVWNQEEIDDISNRCGCFMHHVNRICGAYLRYHERAKTLGISSLQHSELYDPLNTLPDLKRLCKKIFGLKSVKLSNGKRVRL